MDLPPVSYAPRTRQRPLPVVLPVMAGLGIGVSTLFALSWGLLALRAVAWLPHGVRGRDVFFIVLLLIASASHGLMLKASLSMLRYRINLTARLRARVRNAMLGLTGAYLGLAIFAGANGSRGEAQVLVAGIYVIQMIVPAFLLTVLGQPLVSQAYEREARRRAMVGELESGE